MSTRVEYRVTGHGGAAGSLTYCLGPADEFCRRVHHVYVDGTEIGRKVAWRTDCATLCTLADGGPFGQGPYCAENPCGAIGSVQASRANWCPGSVTPPFAWTLGANSAFGAPGPHALRFAIDGIDSGGVWRASAIVYAYGP